MAEVDSQLCKALFGSEGVRCLDPGSIVMLVEVNQRLPCVNGVIVDPVDKTVMST